MELAASSLCVAVLWSSACGDVSRRYCRMDWERGQTAAFGRKSYDYRDFCAYDDLGV